MNSSICPRASAVIARQKIREYYLRQGKRSEICTARDELARLRKLRKKAEASCKQARDRAEAKKVELATAVAELACLIERTNSAPVPYHFTIHPSEMGETDTFFAGMWTEEIGEESCDMVRCVMWFRTRCEEIQREMNLAQRCTNSLANGGNPYETEYHEDIFLLVSKYGYVNTVCEAADIEPLVARELAFHKDKLEEAQDELFRMTLQEVKLVNKLQTSERVKWSLSANSPIITTVKCFIVSAAHGFIEVHADGYIECQVYIPHGVRCAKDGTPCRPNLGAPHAV